MPRSAADIVIWLVGAAAAYNSRIMKPLLSLLVLGAAVHAEPKADFYVSPSGNDKWSGTGVGPTRDLSDGAFRTLARARDAVR